MNTSLLFSSGTADNQYHFHAATIPSSSATITRVIGEKKLSTMQATDESSRGEHDESHQQQNSNTGGNDGDAGKRQSQRILEQFLFLRNSGDSKMSINI